MILPIPLRMNPHLIVLFDFVTTLYVSSIIQRFETTQFNILIQSGQCCLGFAAADVNRCFMNVHFNLTTEIWFRNPIVAVIPGGMFIFNLKLSYCWFKGITALTLSLYIWCYCGGLYRIKHFVYIITMVLR